jgi:murein L,D-transpeptidase YafK
MARRDGRTELGTDIMIHGDSVSIGCLAVGDPASEDLFVLAADTGIRNIKVILSPVDMRRAKPNQGKHQLPKWTDKLYATITEELSGLPEPGR